MTARALPRAAASEAELMAALADGDLSALGELYDRHGEAVRRFALRITGHLDQADDVTHDTFLALVDAAPRYEAPRPVRGFVIGIAGKLVLRARRRTAIGARILAELRAAWGRDDARTPEDVASADEQLARYRRALQRMSHTKRVVVVMADVEGLTGPEIAAALDIPIGTVWTRLHHARAELRNALAKGGRA
ncbi:MAG: RNA polymerase sigma factor [Polyangiaceae bacterium]